MTKEAFDIWSLSDLARAWGGSCVQEALNDFSCYHDQDPVRFLQRHALDYECAGRCRTFLVMDEGELQKGLLRVAAFFTLAMNSISFDDYRGVSFLIAQIARDRRYTHDEYSGKVILREAERLVSEACDRVGGQFIFIDCKKASGEDKDLQEYYEKEGYKPFACEGGYCKLVKRIPA